MSGANDDTKQGRDDPSLYERVVPEGFKRRIEAGVENVMKDGRLKALMGELKLPKEIANHILAQIDETKHAALAVIARETRLFLEKTNLSDELAKLLTQVTFEIKTEVRFVPNDKAAKGGFLPKVRISGPRLKKNDGADAGEAPEPEADEASSDPRIEEIKGGGTTT
jgi:hypothetical protein